MLNKQGRRSKLEVKFEDVLKEFQVDYVYEKIKVPYVVPASDHKYIVDFSTTNGVHFEVKGWLSDHAERQKYILVKQQHPDLDLRFVFDNINKLCGGTKYTHAAWCVKNGFKYLLLHLYQIVKLNLIKTIHF
jgi:hypothetical protein